MSKNLDHSQNFILNKCLFSFLTQARRNLGLFQHHDAITGTSKKLVMVDYLQRLYKSVKDVISIQQMLLEFLLQSDVNDIQNNFIQHELHRENAEVFPTQKTLKITKEKSERIVIFNSLVQKRLEVISVILSTPNVKITNSNGAAIPYQVNPVFDQTSDYEPSDYKFQLLFMADLSPMSLNIFNIMHDENPKLAKIYCKMCKRSEFDYTKTSIQIENSRMKLTFDSNGFLDEVNNNEYAEKIKLKIMFETYKSMIAKSGAYLFKPKSSPPENILEQNYTKVFIVEGPISSEVTVIFGELLQHTVRIFNTKTHLDDALSIVNDINFENPPKFRDKEMVMKLKTSIDNTINNGEPEFYTDQNGFQWLPRRKTPQLDVEGNYYPITSSVFLQDDSIRLTLATTHAQGVASMEKGQLEVMLDRRTSYDDGRGMGEGVLDSVKMQHKFLLMFEFFNKPESEEETSSKGKYQVPSLFAHHLTNSLNYPSSTFFVSNNQEVRLKSNLEFLQYKFSCDMHLVNLRSVAGEDQLSLQSSLLILQRFGYNCQLSNENFSKEICINSDNSNDIQIFKEVKISKINKASLTALKLGRNIQNFNDKVLAPMELKTYLVTYR